MNDVFGTLYARAYDHLYADKDYEGECDLLEKLFCEHANNKVSDVLDLGCGTGGHATVLANRGYRMTGLDRSVDMLSKARTKPVQGSVEFLQADMADFQLERTFDAALMMFAVFGYQHSIDGAVSVLKRIHSHLKPGGPLIFDVWFGPAVLTQKPGARRKTVEDGGGEIVRDVTAELDMLNQLCTVNYALSAADGECCESHVMRFYFPKELELLLRLGGFRIVSLSDFDVPGQPPTEQSWNVICVAVAE